MGKIIVVLLPLGWPRDFATNYGLKLKTLREVRLLKEKELKKLFPREKIIKEKFFGLTKSFVVYNFFKDVT